MSAAALLTAIGLAVLISLWFLVAVPFTMIAMYGAWVGLTNDEIFDAFGTDAADPGAGAPGMTP